MNLILENARFQPLFYLYKKHVLIFSSGEESYDTDRLCLDLIRISIEKINL